MTTSPKVSSDLLTPAAETWLSAGLPEAVPPFQLTAITGGYSMLTFRLTDVDGRIWVLRLPPPGQSAGGAHDPFREARTMSALWDSAVPVPRVRMIGTVDDPLGPCHVTDFVDGFVLSEKSQAEDALSPSAMRDATTNLVTVLASLHAVDPAAVGLANLGPSDDYNGRQVRRWRSAVESMAEYPLSGVAERAHKLEILGAELAARLPLDRVGALVHGDFRLGNTITSKAGEIRAVLDWELVTRGEPIADLGMLLIYWDPPKDALLGQRAPTEAQGSIDADQVVALYAAESGRDVSDVDLYRGLASWRLACLTLRTAVRFAGTTSAHSISPGRFLTTCDIWSDLTRDRLRATPPRSHR